MKKNLLILDLDETLIHSILSGDMNITYDDYKNSFPVLDGIYLTKSRPHLKTLLKYAFGNFKVAVWTAAEEDYGLAILKSIGIDINELEFFYSSKNCTPRYIYDGGVSSEIIYLKNLNKLKRKGYDLNNVIMVDDKAVGLKNSYSNLIEIKPYYGGDDEELLKLIDFLDTLKFKDNIRKIEKRGWGNID